MFDANDLLISIKKAAVDAVEASKPAALIFGKVTSVSPLKINVEQKMTLTSMQLILTKTAEKDLKTNDTVILIRMQGGQKYVVIDKAVIE